MVSYGRFAATKGWARKVATFAQLRPFGENAYGAVDKKAVALEQKLDLS